MAKQKEPKIAVVPAPAEELDLSTIIHPAVMEALKKGDARVVVVGLLKEAANVARAVIAAEKFTVSDVATLWGDALGDALKVGGKFAIENPAVSQRQQ